MPLGPKQLETLHPVDAQIIEKMVQLIDGSSEFYAYNGEPSVKVLLGPKVMSEFRKPGFPRRTTQRETFLKNLYLKAGWVNVVFQIDGILFEKEVKRPVKNSLTNNVVYAKFGKTVDTTFDKTNKE